MSNERSSLEAGAQIEPTQVVRVPGPGVAAAILGARLREFRGEHTLDDAKAESGISPSVVSRLETGQHQPRLANVLGLLRAYGVSEEHREQIEALVALTKLPTKAYDNVPPSLLLYAEYEAYATQITGYYPLLLPEVLWPDGQTLGNGDSGFQRLNRERATYLRGQDAPRQHLIIGGVALRIAMHTPGFSAVDLVPVLENPNITVQVADYTAGAVPLHVYSGQTTHLAFDDPALPPQLYASRLDTEVITMKPSEASPQLFLHMFEASAAQLPGPEDTRPIIEAMA